MTICVDCGKKYNKETAFRVDSTIAGIIGRNRARNICSNCAYNFQDLKVQMIAESSCAGCDQYPCMCDLVASYRNKR